MGEILRLTSRSGSEFRLGERARMKQLATGAAPTCRSSSGSRSFMAWPPAMASRRWTTSDFSAPRPSSPGRR